MPDPVIYRDRDRKFSRYSLEGTGVLRCGGPAGDGTRVMLLSTIGSDEVTVVRADEFAERYPRWDYPAKPGPLRQPHTQEEQIAYDNQLRAWEDGENLRKRWADDDKLVAGKANPAAAKAAADKADADKKAADDASAKRFQADNAAAAGKARGPGQS